jgi:hypothetical protein
VALACTASPVTIFPGEPVTVTATTANLDPKLPATYTWSGVAGLKGNGVSATLDSAATSSLVPGVITVKGKVKQGNPGKEGLKPGQVADCSASFSVKGYEPPSVSCMANPTMLRPGETSTVTVSGASPQNRPLTYSYSATAGTISGSGATATYDSASAPSGAVGISCKVTDDKGGTATDSTSVTIVQPSPPPMPHATFLCGISFDRDRLNPTRVDNTAPACLNEVANALKNDSTATAVVVGESTAMEKKAKNGAAPEDIAAQRAVNAKDYLVHNVQPGIDPSRIVVRTGTTDSKSVEDYLIPAGATFENDVPGTTLVNEAVVKPQPRAAIGGPEQPIQPVQWVNAQLHADVATQGANPANCQGFVIFTYPSVADFGSSNSDSAQLRLYVGPVDAKGTVPGDVVSSACQGISAALNCTDPAKWKMDCPGGADKDRLVIDTDGRTVRGWLTLQNPPFDVCVDLSGFPSGVNSSNGDLGKTCNEASQLGSIPFRWNPELKDKSAGGTKFPMDLRISGMDDGGKQTAGYSSARSIELYLKPQDWLDEMATRITGDPKFNLLAELCGILPPVIAGAIVMWKKRDWLGSLIKRIFH